MDIMTSNTNELFTCLHTRTHTHTHTHHTYTHTPHTHAHTHTHTHTQGAKNLYRRLIHQRLMDNEVVIDDLLTNTGQVGMGMMKRVSSGMVNYASTGILNAAKRVSGQEATDSHGEVGLE